MKQLKAIQGHLGSAKSRYEEQKLFPSLQQGRESLTSPGAFNEVARLSKCRKRFSVVGWMTEKKSLLNSFSNSAMDCRQQGHINIWMLSERGDTKNHWVYFQPSGKGKTTSGTPAGFQVLPHYSLQARGCRQALTVLGSICQPQHNVITDTQMKQHRYA